MSKNRNYNNASKKKLAKLYGSEIHINTVDIYVLYIERFSLLKYFTRQILTLVNFHCSSHRQNLNVERIIFHL